MVGASRKAKIMYTCLGSNCGVLVPTNPGPDKPDDKACEAPGDHGPNDRDKLSYYRCIDHRIKMKVFWQCNQQSGQLFDPDQRARKIVC